MSRVTVGQLVEDFIPHTEESNKIVNVEIAPRKIIEDIIAHCECQADFSESMIEMLEDSKQNAPYKAMWISEASAYREIVSLANGWLAGFEGRD